MVVVWAYDKHDMRYKIQISDMIHIPDMKPFITKYGISMTTEREFKMLYQPASIRQYNTIQYNTIQYNTIL